MPALPENSTARIRVNYRTQWFEHSMMFRFATLAAPATAKSIVEGVIIEMLALCYDNTVFHSADYALEGSNVFNPLPGWAPMNSAGNGTPGAGVSGARFLNFVGRSPSSRRARLYLFGTRYGEIGDMRYSSTDLPAIGAIVGQLNDSPEIVTIDGTAPIWKPYANFGYNDYLTHELRG